MTDLSVQVAGVPFKNPIIPASGVFGYGHEYEELFPLSKLGGIATKGTTITPRPGNPSAWPMQGVNCLPRSSIRRWPIRAAHWPQPGRRMT